METNDEADNVEAPIEIELLPRVGTADISKRLRSSLEICQDLRAAVAFWTIESQFFGSSLTEKLCSPGFLCVDINSPTDLDRLDALDNQGAKIYLHLRTPGSKLEDTETGNLSMPKHLMHTKFLVFDFPDETAEIWTGSHNWTRRALVGPNIELSVVLRISRYSRLYADAVHNLNSIRDLCIPFDHDDLGYYKLLQRNERLLKGPVIELEGDQVEGLEGTSIVVFGTERADLNELDSTDKWVVIEITDSYSKPERAFRYAGRIMQSGLLESANPLASGIAFTECRHAFRVGRRYPVLVGASRPDQVVTEAIYFVNIEIVADVTSRVAVVDLPDPTRRWTRSFNDPLIERMDPKDLNLADGRKVEVRVPANGPSMKNQIEQTYGGMNTEIAAKIPRSLEEKREALNVNLVSKKLLVDEERKPISIEDLTRR